jgi:eukaryotic-like serine/threonine-protein kinase
MRMVAELKGKNIAGWVIGDLVDYGKSALVFVASKGEDSCVLKLFDPEIVERYGEAVQRERVTRERALVGKSHPNLVPILDAGEDGGFKNVLLTGPNNTAREK